MREVEVERLYTAHAGGDTITTGITERTCTRHFLDFRDGNRDCPFSKEIQGMSAAIVAASTVHNHASKDVMPSEVRALIARHMDRWISHRVDERVQKVVPVVGDGQEEKSHASLGKGSEGVPEGCRRKKPIGRRRR